jgi:cell wall-associated NlpC family hydrolase
MVSGLCAFSADAESLSAQKQHLASLQAQAAQNLGQLQQDQQKAASLHQSIAAYQTALATLGQSLAANKAQIAQTEAHLAALNRSIADNQQQLDATKAQFEAQLRAMYETGGVPYLEVLLGATSFDDFLNRLYAIATVAEANRKLARKLTALQQQMVSQRDAQSQIMERLHQEQAELRQTQATYQSLVAKKEAALRQVNARVGAEQRRQGLLESQIRLTQSQIEQIEQETRLIEERMRSRTVTRPSGTAFSGSNRALSGLTSGTAAPASRAAAPSVNGNALVAYAESFIGVPYVWGGTSPDGFDCSGFTQYVYAHFGIHLGRTALDQFGQGVPVDMDQLQPGDLVFFSTYAPGATHVGIYIGNGQMVDAQDEGVTIASIHSSYWAARYIGARRIMTGA